MDLNDIVRKILKNLLLIFLPKYSETAAAEELAGRTSSYIQRGRISSSENDQR